MPLNYAVLSDGNCIIITDTTSATNIETIPKEKVVLQIVLAGEGQNKSGVDELWIQHDGQYSTEIPYTEADVASAGVAPVSVEAFRVAVLALLNVNTFITPFKVYSGYLVQTGTDAPVITVLYNTTGITIATSYIAAGRYMLTPSTLLDPDKTYYNITDKKAAINGVLNAEQCNMTLHDSGPNQGKIIIESGDITVGLQDALLIKTPFIIIIFP